MSTATVVQLKPAAKKRKPAAKPAATAKPATVTRATKWQRVQGAVCGGISATLLAMSLQHQALGVTTTTHGTAFEGWVMAIAIDVGFMCIETMPFTCRAETLADTKWVRLGMSATVYAASAFFNASAFAHGGPLSVASGAMGVAVPAFIAGFLHLATRCILGKAK